MHDVPQLLRSPARAALLAFTLAACSAPAGARRPAVVPPAPPAAPAPAPSGEAPVPACAAPTEGPEARQDASPLLLVLPTGDAHLVLASAPARRGDLVVWDVVYLAATDPAALDDPAARARRASAAGEFLGAFRLLAEVTQSSRLSVTAVLGPPGARGVAEQYGFERAGGDWRPDEVPSRFAVPRVPAISPGVVRDRDAEDRARDAAAAFVADAERGDFDAAWERTSPLAKAAMSRAEFERRVAPAEAARTPGTGPYLAFPAPAGPFLPGAFMEAWITRESLRGASVETLTMRLDDDMEWRVAGVARLTRARPPAEAGGGVEAEAPSPRSHAVTVAPVRQR